MTSTGKRNSMSENNDNEQAQAGASSFSFFFVHVSKKQIEINETAQRKLWRAPVLFYSPPGTHFAAFLWRRRAAAAMVNSPAFVVASLQKSTVIFSVAS